MSDKREHAAALLRRYDALRLELRTLEHELAKACADYGRELGYWGYTREHLRVRLAQEEQ